MSDRHPNEAQARTLQKDRQIVQQIDEALDRLAHGEYGVCRECDAEIAGKRLAALPFAVLCLTCQGLAEVGAVTDREVVWRPRPVSEVPEI